MGSETALQAIKKPAEKEGRPFATGAAEILVHNLSLLRSSRSNEPQPGQYIEPVQLQVVCFQLWRNLPPVQKGEHNEITEEQVDKIGNIDRTLGDFYEQALEETIQKTRVSELELRNWFERQLITEAGTRGTVFQGVNSTGGVDNRVVRLLENLFLVRAESRSGAIWYELMHDRFVDPILQANLEWLEGQVLLRDAQIWTDSGRKEKILLYTGKKLENALAGIDDDTSLEPVAMAFLNAGRAEQERIQDEEKAQVRQAEEKRRKKGMLALSAGLVIALFLSMVAGWQWWNADKARQNAIVQTGIANRSKVDAERQRDRAEQKRLEANYNLAKVFEEKALGSLNIAEEKNDVEGYKQAVLFASAALEQNIESDKSALSPMSAASLFAPEAFNTALAESWASPSTNTHPGECLSVSFSPDGKKLASTSEDKTVRLWDIQAGKELAVFKGHERAIFSVAFSPDGKKLASASEDNTVRLWDIKTSKELTVFNGHDGTILNVAFSPDGKKLASASEDNTVRLWDIKTGKELTVLRGHEKKVTSVAFSPDGKKLASASEDKTVRLWDIQTGKKLTVFKGHEEEVTSVAFSPDGSRLVSASGDGTVLLWDVASVIVLRVFTGHTASVNSVSFSPDGKLLGSASEDGTVRLWDVASVRVLRVFTGHTASVNSVSFSPDDKLLGSASDDGTVRLWDISSTELTMFGGHTAPVSSISYSPDGGRLASASWDKTVRLWNTESGKELTVFTGYTDRINNVAFSPKGTQLASASDDGTVRLWDIASGRQVAILAEHVDRISSVAFSPDGTRLASASSDGTVRLWDVTSAKEMNVFKGHKDRVSSVSISPDGRFFASASGDGTVRLWDVASGRPVGILEGHTDRVSSVAFSPDGKKLASASSDRTVRLWDVTSGKMLNVFKGHKDRVSSVSISPDGRWLASASWDKTVRVWDIESGQEMRVISDYTGFIQSISFSPDNTQLAAASGDNIIIRSWDFQFIRLFLQGGRSTPLYHRFMEGIRFLWQVKLDGLDFVLADRRTPADLKKYGALLAPPPPGKNKFDQVLEWAEKQQKNEAKFMEQQ